MDAPKDILTRISESAADLLKKRIALVEAQDALTRAEKDVSDLEQKVIPELMEEAGVDAVTTKDGVHLILDYTVRTNTKNPALHEWLRQIGNGGLIKSEVSVPFAKGSEEESRKLLQDLENVGLKATFTQEVHWSSFQTLVKDLRKKGVEVPLSELGITLANVVKVTMPK